MKRIALVHFFLFTACTAFAQDAVSAREKNKEPADSFYLLSPVEVKSIRAGDKAPFTKTNLSKADIQKANQGQDIPFILNHTPSVVVNSDAGNGIGYTGLRIRGTDATRINFTINGIPFNDAESQGAFLVNLPDFTSSVSSIQIQRGVGTSSNGTGAFGATISLSTNEINRKAYAEFNNSFGSFNSWKHTVKAGTGLINNHFTLDTRLSQITSDGFIDRAGSNLRAFYLSGAYIGNTSSLRFTIFSGKEKTYQAWNGIPEAKLKGNKQDLLSHYYNNLGSLYFTTADSVNLFSAGKRKYNLPLYENETDNYSQSHYQLFFNQKLNDNWIFHTALFLTRGLGYYENFKAQEKFSKYGLPDFTVQNTTFKRTDLVRQKWLDNYFYGQIFSVNNKKDNHTWTTGGGWTTYDGIHHGDITWAQFGIEKGYRYYEQKARKTDINFYTKWQYRFSKFWNLFADLQYRSVVHDMNGFEKRPSLHIIRKFGFLNPKGGVQYAKNGWQFYASYAIANKEPNRDDFEAGYNMQPRKETLQDIEAGIEKRTATFFAGVTLYNMIYKDQLVMTGMINDVGAYTRTNIPDSYRAGIELEGGYIITPQLNITANLTLSRNKIKSFIYFLDMYDSGFEWLGQNEIVYKNTDIAFSPSVTGAATINIFPLKNLEISLLSKYAGKQYMDNTQSETKKLNGFFIQDARIILIVKNKIFSEWNITGRVMNIFNKSYEPNGYTWGYLYDGNIVTENFYFPMSGTNYMLGLNINL